MGSVPEDEAVEGAGGAGEELHEADAEFEALDGAVARIDLHGAAGPGEGFFIVALALIGEGEVVHGCGRIGVAS